MEHPHTLLMLVLKQHYQNRLHVIDDAKKVIDGYKTDRNPNYEKTLGILYQLMNDLPPDILLYFLTMVPLPEGPMSSTSTLIELMKQMHSTNLLNNMRPTLLQYLNNQMASVTVKQSDLLDNKNEFFFKTEIDNTLIDNKIKILNVTSVIDENIRREKNKNRKKVKAKAKVTQKKTNQIKSLTLLCALNILKNEKNYKKKYENLKKEAWNLVNSKNINKVGLNQCYNVIRDTNRKMRWLNVARSGEVPLELIRDEYGSSEVFYQERHLHNPIPDDLLDLGDALKLSIDHFLSKC